METSVDTAPETVLPDRSTELATETSLNSFIEPKIEPDLQEPRKQETETTLLVKTPEPKTKTVLQTESVIESQIEIESPEEQTENATCQQTPQNCYKRRWNYAERRRKIQKKETDTLLAYIKEQNETLKEISSHLIKRNILLENQNEKLINIMENQNLLITKLLEKI
ncbi:uncharacterized protein LOC118180295 [Stegodyphus dumicola]|uniref:uncharacterized protein LOC118180295 n=1 Tax=Stegodyphus dumicola TaxID=202533 RepID=UPI0015AED7F8|nr:uncharacterized protein LOC118180295 [Stegodyphus dumicola]